MDKLQCLICYKSFDHLGNHVVKAHKITAREYKAQFELDFKYPLISHKVKVKKQLAFEEDREKYLANITGEKSKKYQFKKGVSNRTRFAQQSIDRATNQLAQINGHKHALCPVCKVGFDHMESHLYNKHGLKLATK